MRKSEFLALSGAAALCFAVSPILTNTSSAMVAPEEAVTIDYVDVTNYGTTTIEDENLAKYVSYMAEHEGLDNTWCMSFNDQGEMYSLGDCEDGQPFIEFSADGDKVNIYDDNSPSDLRVYKNAAIDAYFIDGAAVSYMQYLEYIGNTPDAENSSAIRYNFAKFFVGIGHAFIDGENQTFVKGSEEGVVVHTTGGVADLVSVAVDGKELSEEYYTTENGSIVFTLKADYLNGLEAGKHTLKMNFDGDEALTTSFTIEANPETSDLPVSVVITFIVCTVLSTATMAYMEISKKIRR